jgi:hypothetical protein
MNRQNVAKWCRGLEAGRTEVHDEERSGRPSVVTDCVIKRKLRKKFALIVM